MIHLVKVHDLASGDVKAPGTKVLVDRLWPRGVAEDDVDIDEWFKSVAPSTELRKWFNHDAEKFDEFTRRYTRELDDGAEGAGSAEAAEVAEELKRLASFARNGALSLLFAAKDREHNHAVVLKDWLEGRLRK